MRRVLAIAAAVLFSVVAPAHAAEIYVKNVDSRLTTSEIKRALPVFESASKNDFAPEWGVSADLKLLPAGADAPAGAWVIYLTENPPCLFCAGFHAVTDGVPYAVVGVFDPDTANWTVTFTHELWEMLVDPYINRGMRVKPTKAGPYQWYALETADPVEGEQFAYTRNGIKISDFVTEAWFRRGSKGPWDFTRSCTRPLQILEDGYQLVWRNGTWTSTYGHIKAS